MVTVGAIGASRSLRLKAHVSPNRFRGFSPDMTQGADSSQMELRVKEFENLNRDGNQSDQDTWLDWQEKFGINRWIGGIGGSNGCNWDMLIE
jgi:hypothetical protein